LKHLRTRLPRINATKQGSNPSSLFSKVPASLQALSMIRIQLLERYGENNYLANQKLMTNAFMIHGKLYLFEQPVERVAITAPKGKHVIADNDNTNAIWIYDRSGSMSGTLHGLVEDMILKLQTLKQGDTLTIGWFSSEGERNWIVKGYQITNPASDAKKLETMLRKNNHTLGTTCFSEILADTKQVVEDLRTLNPIFTLAFFTDGYPVVSNYQREVQNIQTAIDAVKGDLSSVLFIGYGGYYNKELMSDMSQRAGGSLVHSSNLGEFSASLTEFMEDSREIGVRVSVKPEVEEALVFFGINGRTINIYTPDKEGNIQFIQPRKGRNSLFAVSTSGSSSGVSEKFDGEKDKGLLRAAYAASMALTQRTKTNVALEFLGAIGDVNLIDLVANAFTNDEYGRAEARIRKAVSTPKGRFVRGKNTSYLPDPNAFCMVDAMDLIMADDSARFFPYHPNFKYDRIGTKSVAKEGAPKFEPFPNPACPMDKLVWNSTKLNLSVLNRIEGTVKLDAEANKLGFTEQYPTFIWRNYSFVKDGFTNIPKGFLALSQQTFCKFQKHGMISAEQVWVAGEAVEVNFNAIPVMNRGMAEGKTSAKALAQLCWRETELEGQLKVLREKSKSLGAAGAVDFAQRSALTPAQEAYLAKFFIGKNGFSAPSEKEEVKDFYMAKEFDVKIAGFSSWPKVSDVVAKITEGKKELKPSEKVMAEGLKILSDKSAPTKPSDLLTWINGRILLMTNELRAVRKQIQRTKFAILLGKAWFEEFTSREENTLEIGNQKFTFSLREVKVNI
jgi:hypothetical protein